ncbi:subunit of tubulin prefoldin, partial [Ascosphaera atra]
MASQAKSAPPGTIDLGSLSVQQLRALQQRLDQELEHLATSHAKLRAAQTKFRDCIKSITDGVEDKSAKDGDHILIPLTNSLYVKGKMESRDKVLVDVGTGYYVEKTREKAVQFYEGKAKDVEANLKELNKVLEMKTMNARVIAE